MNTEWLPTNSLISFWQIEMVTEDDILNCFSTSILIISGNGNIFILFVYGL